MTKMHPDCGLMILVRCCGKGQSKSKGKYKHNAYEAYLFLWTKFHRLYLLSLSVPKIAVSLSKKLSFAIKTLLFSVSNRKTQYVDYSKDAKIG
jgi:hypothetical protein